MRVSITQPGTSPRSGPSDGDGDGDGGKMTRRAAGSDGARLIRTESRELLRVIGLPFGRVGAVLGWGEQVVLPRAATECGDASEAQLEDGDAREHGEEHGQRKHHEDEGHHHGDLLAPGHLHELALVLVADVLGL